MFDDTSKNNSDDTSVKSSNQPPKDGSSNIPNDDFSSPVKNSQNLFDEVDDLEEDKGEENNGLNDISKPSEDSFGDGNTSSVVSASSDSNQDSMGGQSLDKKDSGSDDLNPLGSETGNDSGENTEQGLKDMFFDSDPVSVEDNVEKPDMIESENTNVSDDAPISGEDLFGDDDKEQEDEHGFDNSMFSDEYSDSDVYEEDRGNAKKIVLGVVGALFLIMIGFGVYFAFFNKEKNDIPRLDEINQQDNKKENNSGENTVKDIPKENIQEPENDDMVSDKTTIKPSIDSDLDGLPDDVEKEIGTDPLRADTDNDGLFDNEEVNIYKTNPLIKDTDNDGYIDGVEVRGGYNPKGPGKLFGQDFIDSN